MPLEISEEDWKTFCELQEIARQRFCANALAAVNRLLTKSAEQKPFDRHVALFQLMKQRERELRYAFDMPKRAEAIAQIARIKNRGLWTPDEFARFSEAARKSVNDLLEVGKRQKA